MSIWSTSQNIGCFS